MNFLEKELRLEKEYTVLTNIQPNQMTAKEYTNLLQNPTLLRTISYEVLDNLLLQHPYCHGLRLFLLKKYKMDEHKSFDRNLHLGAIYLPDRKLLHQYLHTNPANKQAVSRAAIANDEPKILEDQPTENQHKSDSQENPAPEKQQEAIVPKEEIETKTKDLLSSEVVKKTLPKFESKVSQDPPSFSLPLTSESDSDEEDKKDAKSENIEEWLQNFHPPRIEEESKSEEKQEEKKAEKEKNLPKKKRFKLPRIPTLEDKSVLEVLAKKAEEKKNEQIAEDNPLAELQKAQQLQPIQKNKKKKDLFGFSSDTAAFLKSLSESKDQPLERVELDQEIDSPKKAEDKDLDTLAEQSIMENDEIISETLANLLALQGKKEKAIKMYQALCLKFPEKSRFFAQKIERLQKDN